MLNLPSVSPKQALPLILEAFEAGRSVNLIGAPGVGKTSLIRAVSKALGQEEEYIYYLSLYQQGDFFSPVIDSERKVLVPYPTEMFYTLSELSRKKRLTVGFDELDKADRDVKRMCLQLFLEKKVGSISFAPQTCFIAASNSPEDGSDSEEFTTEFARRMVHYYIQPNPDEWCKEYAPSQGIDTRIIATVKARPELLLWNERQVREGHMLGSSPAAMENINKYISTSTENFRCHVMGEIGEQAGSVFISTFEETEQIPDMEELFKCPSNKLRPILPTKISSLYGLIYSMSSYIASVENLSRGFEILSLVADDRAEIAMWGGEMLCELLCKKGWASNVINLPSYMLFSQKTQVDLHSFASITPTC